MGLIAAKGLRPLVMIVLAGPLLAGGVSLLTLAGPISPGQASAQEQALRKRVEDFYNLMQAGKWSQAENYFTEDSREKFRNQEKHTFQSFQIASVKLDPDEQGATVVVQVRSLVPGFAVGPVPHAESMAWRLVEGIWYAVVPKLDPNAFLAPFHSQAGKGSSPPALPPEELKFKGHSYRLGDIAPGQVKTARFPFTNVTQHPVTISKVDTGCDCLTLKTEKRRYEPGESGELVVDFNSKDYELDYIQTMVVTTEPGGLITFLNVSAFVLPRPRARPKSAGQPMPPKEP